MTKTTHSIIALMLACSACSKNAPEKPTPTAVVANEPTPAQRLPACEVVTEAEMTKILGTPVKAERFDRNTCRYTSPDGFMPYVELKLEWGAAEAQAIAAGIFGRQEKGMVNRFEGIGDSANSIGPALFVRRGEDLITMELIGVDDMAVTAKAIYAIASPRLPAAVRTAASASPDDDTSNAIAEAVKRIPGIDSSGGGLADIAKALTSVSGDAAVKSLPVDPRSNPSAADANASKGSAVPLGTAEHIPLIPGLTVTGAVSDSDGDYEPILEIREVRPDAYDVTFSADVPAFGRRRPIAVLRRVRNDDQRTARTMRSWFGEGDEEEFPGTAPHLSSAMIDDLRARGTTSFTLIDSTTALYIAGIVQTFTGTLTRIEREPVALDVLVNGRLTKLPAIHARGVVSDRTTTRRFEFWVLDDRVNPLVLKSQGETARSQVVKIEYPVAERAAEIERALEKGETVDVYGIYFDFRSATIRPQSTPVLEEIASIMRRHSDWSLDLAGFTDSIGSDAANLDLSRRRTAAVKQELAARFGVAADRLQTNGFGEGSPKATNDTPEGRAQNRRVEITRRRSS